MIKLFFHIGIEKTGSSHLQSISAINRDVLQQNGIWFPYEGKNDDLLIKGEISAGNAQSLTDAINTNNFNFCESFLAKCAQDAKEKSCHSLFLSNELLLIALAKDNKLNQFIKLLNRMGFFDIRFLLVLRDPVDQALSLYKHRAKSGNVLDIEEWPKEHYLYGEALNSFLKQVHLEKINLQVRKFSKIKGALENILFKVWLNIQDSLKQPPKLVNPSLSLSELMLLKKVRQYQPYLVNLLYNKLIKVNKNNKCESSLIELYHQAYLSIQIAKYEDTWKICDQFLPQSEQLSFPKENSSPLSISDKVSSFSDQQMEVIASIISDSLSFRVRFQINKIRFKAQILKVLRAVKLKK